MSKIDELFKRDVAFDEEQTEIKAKWKAEDDELTAEFDKLDAEFLKKCKSSFRGIKVLIEYEVEVRFIITIGEKRQCVKFAGPSVDTILSYCATSWVFNPNFIDRKLAEKLRALYIEYYGEL